MCRITLIVVLLIAPAWAGRAERAEQASELFQTERLISIRIRMGAEQWRMMQPEKASKLAVAMQTHQRPTTRQVLEMLDGGPDNASEDQPPREGERRPPGLVGNEYAYVKAQVNIDGQAMKDVGVRFKGQWSYTLSGTSPRRPLKLAFDHFVDGQEYSGIQTLSLNTNAVDPSQIRESLAYEFFRSVGVPASRTCLAMVYLSVEGLYDNELLGLYTAVEEVDKDFLKRQFDTTKGLVIRPERTRNLAHFGEEWWAYDRYNIQTDPTPLTAGQFIGFTRLIHRDDDATFAREIGGYIDPEEFLKLIAANVIIVNTDGVLVNGHNYYIHIHPKTGQLTFIPWDLHISFGSSSGDSMEQWAGMAIDKPYRSTNRLLERVLATSELREKYRSYLKEMAEGAFTPEKLNPRIDALEAVVKKAEAAAKVEGKELPPALQTTQPRKRPELKPFVEARRHSVLEQLAGRIEGVPIEKRPPPPKVNVPAVVKPLLQPPARTKPGAATRPAPPPKPLPISPLATQVVTWLDADRDAKLTREEAQSAAKHFFLARIAMHRGNIDERMMALTLDYLGRLLDAFPPSFDEAAPQQPSPLAGTWAKALLPRAAADGSAGLKELLAATEGLFAEADANRDGLLIATELSLLFDKLVPRQ